MAEKIYLAGLDAGHGLKTAGKQTPTGIKEWTLNDKVRDKVVEFLKGYNIKFVFPDNNEGNTDESLASRLNMYLNAGVDVFVSIHHNAFTGSWNAATGVEVYYDRTPIAEDKRLADCIYKRLVEYTGMQGRGVKAENWYVINQDRIPAVLVEGGFMDGSKDYNYIISDAGQTEYARAVADGLIEFLGLKKTSSTTTTTPTPSVTPNEKDSYVLHRIQVGAFSKKENADAQLKKVKAAGFDAFIVQVDGLYKIQVGAFSVKANADAQLKKVKAAGFDAFITTQGGKAVTTTTPAVEYYPKYTGTSNGIDTVFRAIGVPEKYLGNYKDRKPIAEKNGVKGYTGDMEQNLYLVGLAKAGKLKKV